MSWIVDTNHHIHAPLEDSEQKVLAIATHAADIASDRKVLVDVFLKGKETSCVCGAPFKGEMNFYHVILHTFVEEQPIH